MWLHSSQYALKVPLFIISRFAFGVPFLYSMLSTAYSYFPWNLFFVLQFLPTFCSGQYFLPHFSAPNKFQWAVRTNMGINILLCFILLLLLFTFGRTLERFYVESVICVKKNQSQQNEDHSAAKTPFVFWRSSMIGICIWTTLSRNIYYSRKECLTF